MFSETVATDFEQHLKHVIFTVWTECGAVLGVRYHFAICASTNRRAVNYSCLFVYVQLLFVNTLRTGDADLRFNTMKLGTSASSP